VVFVAQKMNGKAKLEKLPEHAGDLCVPEDKNNMLYPTFSSSLIGDVMN